MKVWTWLAAVCLTAAIGSAPCLAAAPAAATAHTVRRTVLALYDGARSASARDTPVHTLAEMPLNHLGLVVRYHDIRQGLPAIDTLDDVRGVVTWFVSEGMPNPRGYLRWIEDLARAGKPLVVMGFLGAIKDEHDEPVPLDVINRALGCLGWRYDGGWHTTTAGAAYEIVDQRLIGFERTLPRLVPPYAAVRASAADAKPVLRVAMPNRPAAGSDLVIISPRGAFVAPGYAYFADRSGDREFRQWYLNPFEFFRQAFATAGPYASLAAAKAAGAVTVAYGVLFNTIVNFLIVAAALFIVIKGMNATKKQQAEAPAAPPAPSKEALLLTEIRDLLARR